MASKPCSLSPWRHLRTCPNRYFQVNADENAAKQCGIRLPFGDRQAGFESRFYVTARDQVLHVPASPQKLRFQGGGNGDVGRAVT